MTDRPGDSFGLCCMMPSMPKLDCSNVHPQISPRPQSLGVSLVQDYMWSMRLKHAGYQKQPGDADEA